MLDTRAILMDPNAPPSVVWRLVEKVFGKSALDWEPETFRLELARRSVAVSEGLMAKLLGAQTICATNAWTTDHDVLFAFALACDGVPAASDAIHHPTPEQLCWAVKEITQLTGRVITDDEGFDPDTIDAAVAMVLIFDGMLVAPAELHFCQDVVDMHTKPHAELTARVKEKWEELAKLDDAEMISKLEKMQETPLSVQLMKLADCRRFIAERVKMRAAYVF